MRAALPAANCTFRLIEERVWFAEHVNTVVLAGHSLPPDYLGRPAAEVAATIQAYTPELIVLDTCYGASTPLIEALAAAGSRARVVAPPFPIPEEGLFYEPAFITEHNPVAREHLVRTEPPFPLLHWTVDGAQLRALEDRVAHATPSTLRANLSRNRPPLVRMALPNAEAPILVLVPVARFRLP
jgi:hypothetical protein